MIALGVIASAILVSLGIGEVSQFLTSNDLSHLSEWPVYLSFAALPIIVAIGGKLVAKKH